MKEDRAKEKNAGRDSDGPVLLGSPMRMFGRELANNRPRNQAENHQPCRMDVDGNAGDGDDVESGTSGHHGLSAGSRPLFLRYRGTREMPMEATEPWHPPPAVFHNC